MNKLRQHFRNSLFRKSFSYFRKSPRQLLYAAGFDALFVISLLLLSNIISFFMMNYRIDIQNFLRSSPIGVLYAILFLTAYLCIFTLIYSFFKCMVLDRLCIVLNEKRRITNNFWPFFRLNIFVIGIGIMAPYIIASILVYFFQRPYSSYMAAIFLILYFFFYYPLINLSHYSFLNNMNAKKSLSEALTMAFSRVKNYIPLHGWSLLAVLVYLIFYYGISLLTGQWLRYGLNAYYSTLSIITIVFLYALLFFNRVYFYEIYKNG